MNKKQMILCLKDLFKHNKIHKCNYNNKINTNSSNLDNLLHLYK